MNKTEILHYLRTSSKIDDPGVDKLIEDCMAEVNKATTPKTIYKIFDCQVTSDKLIVDDYVFQSRRLASTIANCKKICIFAATLGTQCDILVRRASATSIAKGAVMQSVLASKIEEVCDGVEDELKQQNLILRRRYSPGYFDLDITEQKKIFQLLDITKRIGITLSDTCQMIPTKSVTAIIGIE